MKLKTIVYVDRGDIIRAPLAAYYTNYKLIEYGLKAQYIAFSRRIQGVAPDDPVPPLFDRIYQYPPDLREPFMVWLEHHNIDMSGHISTPIDPETARCTTCIVAMDRKTLTSLHSLYPDCAWKMNLLTGFINPDFEISDPDPEITFSQQE